MLAAEARIEQALEQTTECNFSKTPLRDAVKFLSQSHGIPVLIDERALADAMMEPTEPVTFSIRGVTFASALNLMLRPLDLTWTISDEVLLVTTGYELPFLRGFGPIPGGNSDVPEGSAPPTGGGMF